MKRMIIAVPLLLAFVVVASLTCILLLNDTEKQADGFIADISESAMRGDFDSCGEALEGFAAFWDGRKSYYLFFVRHEEMHDIETGIEQMKGFARCRDQSGIIGELEKLKTVLKHISESELPLFRNIL